MTKRERVKESTFGSYAKVKGRLPVCKVRNVEGEEMLRGLLIFWMVMLWCCATTLPQSKSMVCERRGSDIVLCVDLRKKACFYRTREGLATLSVNDLYHRAMGEVHSRASGP